MDIKQHAMDNVCFKGAEPLDFPKVKTENRLIPVERLFDAFFAVLDRSDNRKPIDPKMFRRVIGRTNYSVRYASTRVMDRLKIKEKVVFEDLFSGLRVRGEYVATFLAILELIKENVMFVMQEGDKLYCKRGENDVELDIREEY